MVFLYQKKEEMMNMKMQRSEWVSTKRLPQYDTKVALEDYRKGLHSLERGISEYIGTHCGGAGHGFYVRMAGMEDAEAEGGDLERLLDAIGYLVEEDPRVAARLTFSFEICDQYVGTEVTVDLGDDTITYRKHPERNFGADWPKWNPST